MEALQLAGYEVLGRLGRLTHLPQANRRLELRLQCQGLIVSLMTMIYFNRTLCQMIRTDLSLHYHLMTF